MSTVTGTGTVTALRDEIDQIDHELVELVERRREVSRAIQAARMSAGGPRVVHAREAEVVERWRSALGSPGSRIALALLELGRGELAGPSPTRRP